MSDQNPFGADTLVIPFTMQPDSASPPPRGGMTRMRPAGGLYRYGVVDTSPSPADAAGSGPTESR